jgi:hypothetical protein
LSLIGDRNGEVLCQGETGITGKPQAVMQILKAGVLYSALVFGAGFVLGPIRILWVVPRFGTRMAELMETPILFVVIIVAARWTARRLAVPAARSSRLAIDIRRPGIAPGSQRGISS